MEFEPRKAHILDIETAEGDPKMLYQEKVLGQASAFKRLASLMRLGLGVHKPADLDLTGLSAHLSRDLGLWDGQAGLVSRRDWR